MLEELSISSMGFAEDGAYHNRFAQTEAVTPVDPGEAPIWIEYYLRNYDETWSQGMGWVMWEFQQPIDLDCVESVCLNGQIIPV